MLLVAGIQKLMSFNNNLHYCHYQYYYSYQLCINIIILISYYSVFDYHRECC